MTNATVTAKVDYRVESSPRPGLWFSVRSRRFDTMTAAVRMAEELQDAGAFQYFKEGEVRIAEYVDGQYARTVRYW